jgi:hypothetical protein
MPNERYIKLPMRERWHLVPLDRNGDPAFQTLGVMGALGDKRDEFAVMSVFTPAEIVHLVNKALYGMKYQRETHAARRAKITPPKETK